jgi:hypothetical protein
MFSTRMLVIALALAACEPDYAYVPITNATVVAGRIAADYRVPRAAPRGDVRLASYGMVDLGSPNDEADRIRAFHLRVTLIDDSDRPWTMDTRDQRLDLDGWGTSVAAFASASAGSSPPIVTVPPKGKRVVDLFFPLPAPLQHAKQLPRFDAIWRVRADPEDVIERTSFERIMVQPPDTYDSLYDYGNDYYWGPPYWYDPRYRDASFRGAADIPTRYVGQPLYVHRSSIKK